jgi:hypothetical protein
VAAALRERSVPFQLWTERYSSEAHLAVKLALLQRRVLDPSDWITIADSDEFASYGGDTIAALTRAAAAAGAAFVMGQLEDRVAESGELEEVRPGPPSALEQFPLRCGVVRRISGGSTLKVAALRAAWRTNTGNHQVVSADRARRYFGPASAGVRNERGGWLGAADLWPLTPYAGHEAGYRREGEEGDREGLLEAVQFERVVTVWHLKWHRGVLQSAADRLAFYRGNVTDAADGAAQQAQGAGGGQEAGEQRGGEQGVELPRFNHYRESARILAALRGGRVDVEAAGCIGRDGAPARNARRPRR